MATARRTRTATETGSASSSFAYRYRVGNVVILLALSSPRRSCSTSAPCAAGLRAEAAGQLKVTDVDQAVRGAIVDRNFDKPAFTTEARALTFQPAKIRKQLAEARQKSPSAPDRDQRLADIASDVAGKLNNKPDYATVLKKLKATRRSSTWRARSTPVSPKRSPRNSRGGCRASGSAAVSRRLAGRQYRRRDRLGRTRAVGPGGDSMDAVLAGVDGSITHDRGSGRRGHSRQLPQPPPRGQWFDGPADARR